MVIFEPILSAAIIGLLGSVHCVGMCGGIAGALGVAVEGKPGSRWLQLIAYGLGRTLSYGVAGGIVGAVGAVLTGQPGLMVAGMALRVLTGLLMIALGLYLGGWWLGVARIERIGAPLWRGIEPLATRLLARQDALGALRIGVVWGWLPCGLVYSTLALAATAADALTGAAIMLAFGLGTLPAMSAAGLFGHGLRRLLAQRWSRQAAGALVMLFGLYVLARVVLAAAHPH